VERHTREACQRFCEAVLGAPGNPPDGVWAAADALFRGGQGSFVCRDIPVPGSRRWPTMTLEVRRVASCEGREFGFCDDSSVRPGSHTVLLKADKRYTRVGDPVSVEAFLRTVGEFLRAFGPTFGFGCREFNHWSSAHHAMPPPETRLWPVTIFDLDSYPDLLKARLARLVRDGGGTWRLSIEGDSHAVLRHDPLDVSGLDIDPSASEAVIGDGEGMMAPHGECGLRLMELCSRAT
jgi:hypothetical protein